MSALASTSGDAEVGVVALPLPGEEGVHGVVDVVGPLRRHAHPALGGRGHHHGVVEVGLGDERERAPDLGRQRGDLVGELGQQVPRRVVDQRVHGVEPQRVQVEVPQPAQGVVADPAAHAPRLPGPSRLTAPAPRRLVRLGEVRAERVQVVPGRPEVVVDDVEADRETAGVRLVDEPLQRRRAAVRLVHRVQVDAVVAPAVLPVERGDRHELDGRHPEVDEVVEPLDGGVERARVGERAEVQLVDDAVAQVGPAPVAVGPAVPGHVEHAARAVHAGGLPGAARVRARVRAVDGERVVVAVREVGLAGGRGPPAVGGPLERDPAVGRGQDELRRLRRPGPRRSVASVRPPGLGRAGRRAACPAAGRSAARRR